jgi:hypothetical protein
MIMRISLVVALIGLILVVTLNLVSVRQRLATATAQREQFRVEKEQASVAQAEAARQVRERQGQLASASAELEKMKTERDEVLAKTAEAAKRSIELGEKSKTVLHARDLARRGLAEWTGLGVPIERVGGLNKSLKSAEDEEKAVQAELGILVAEDKRLRKEARVLGIDSDVFVYYPASVLVVDPRYDFVVLDKGQKDDVLEGENAIASRDGKISGRLKITRVEESRSIAYLVPGSAPGMPREGDQVILWTEGSRWCGNGD